MSSGTASPTFYADCFPSLVFFAFFSNFLFRSMCWNKLAARHLLSMHFAFCIVSSMV